MYVPKSMGRSKPQKTTLIIKRVTSFFVLLAVFTGGYCLSAKAFDKLCKSGFRWKTNVGQAIAPLKIIIKGVVIDKSGGLPLAGAIVKAGGTNIGVVTNAQGKFLLYADSDKTQLVIACTGYRTLQVNIEQHNSLKTIELEPNNDPIDEAIVMGYHNIVAGADDKNAHPHLGWQKFQSYLKENAVTPGGNKGTVKLSFKVDHDGTITDIKIIKGCGKVTDQKVIDLINNGPEWVGNVNGKIEKVDLLVEFAR